MANTQMSERRPSTPLHQVVDRELTWVQSGAFSRRHELRAGDEAIAGGGRFRFATGERRFRWGCSSFWRMEWEIGREDGPALLTIANSSRPR